MKITVTYGSKRPKPHVGDRKVVRGVEHIRVLRYVMGPDGRKLGLDCTNGRQHYDWVPVSEARQHGAAHHWTSEERAKYDNEYPPGYMQMRGAA